MDETEFKGLVQSGIARLKDACNKSLSAESRFDLAYNAAQILLERVETLVSRIAQEGRNGNYIQCCTEHNH